MKKAWSQWKLFLAPLGIFLLLLFSFLLAPSLFYPEILGSDAFLVFGILSVLLALALVFLVIPILLIVNTARLIRQGAPQLPTVLFPIVNIVLTFGFLFWVALISSRM